MWFGILGGVEVRSAGGRVVPVGGPRVRALLALLLLNTGQFVSSERLIDGLYGEDPPRGAANALQSQVSRLRRGLKDAAGDDPSGDPVEYAPAGYRLAADPENIDVHRFGRLAAEGRRALAAGHHRRAATLLREALGLWRGPALADVTTAPYAEAQVARLEELRVSAVEDRAEAELAMGGHRELIAELQEMVAVHPLRERLRGQLMRALCGSGRQAEALAVFEDARRTLAGELGADPSPELAAVHLSVLRGEPALTSRAHTTPAITAPPADAGSVTSADVMPTDVMTAGITGAGVAGATIRTAPTRPPAQLTSFVGRAEDLRRIGELLAAGRLVTLIGPGGAGKTRLAIEAAAHEPGEVCFVDLAPIGADDGAGPPGAVLQAVADALGLRETGPLTPAPGTHPDVGARLVASLTDRPMLLVLDNCEHVVEDAARLTLWLLGVCPGLRVLATSRAALGITGESLCPVPPLSPAPAGTEARDALGYPAVRLFADRAAAVRPGLEVDALNIESVLRICAALDGLPLAIELAAARLRSLTVDEVCTRLDDRFRLLSRGDRTKARRHQTLSAVVEWSWDLLGEDERILARRLTVFTGGATLEAVAQVCGLAAREVDGLLADLVDKSLVEEAGGRYRMLETIREFCAGRLAEAGEEERTRAAHASCFLRLAETAEPYMRRAEQLDWLARLGADHGNLLTALRWATRADQGLALRLLAALSSYWWLRGLRSEGGPVAVELIRAIGPEPPAGLEEEYILAVLVAVHSGADMSELGDRRRLVDSTMAGLSEDHPPLRPMISLLWAIDTGPTDTNVELQSRLMAQDPWSRALRHFGRGFIRMYGGDIAAADAEFDAAALGFRTVGERWGLSGTLAAQARLAGWRGDRDRSLALADKAFELVKPLGATEDIADLLCLRGDGLLRSGDLDGARDAYERAADLARKAGAEEKVAEAWHGLAEVARLRGDLAEARRLNRTALGMCSSESFAVHETRVHLLIGLGRVAAAEGNARQARSWLDQALALSLADENIAAAADVTEALADVALLDGDAERAAVLLGAGTALRGTPVADDPDAARVAGLVKGLIGPAAHASAHARGSAMDRDEVLAFLECAPVRTPSGDRPPA